MATDTLPGRAQGLELLEREVEPEPLDPVLHARETARVPETIVASLNRTLSGWEILFHTFIVLLGTALLIDLWLILRPGS
ncbi:MAG: hypothetical protein KY468_10575 [Armatimonadetes bacterium]|nr:hypothetical protein [Armatimonadota bacterium]